MKITFLYISYMLSVVSIALPARAALSRHDMQEFAMRVWAVHSNWESHIEWALNQEQQCRESRPLNDLSPCNIFVGSALKTIWGLSDFETTKGHYLDANQITDYVLTHHTTWKLIGSGGQQSTLDTAEQLANNGDPVIAIRPAPYPHHGHVALILPGRLRSSPSWHENVPNSASFFYERPKKSYIGGRLSSAFRSSEKYDVKIYTRVTWKITTH